MRPTETVWCPLCRADVEGIDLLAHKWDEHPLAASAEQQDRADRAARVHMNRTRKGDSEEPIEVR